MHRATLITFGARLAGRRFSREGIAWFFNVPPESLSDPTPPQAEPPKPEEKIQIGPLDV